MRLVGTSATNWLENIKKYGRKFNDILEIYETTNSSFISTTPLSSFSQNDINRINYSVDSKILKSEMGKLVVDINKSSASFSYLEKNRFLRYKLQLLNDDGSVLETCDYGWFVITDIEEQKDKKSVLVTCYDGMIKSMKDYYTPKHYVVTEDTEFDLDKTYYERINNVYSVYTGTTTGNPHTLGLYEYTEITFPITLLNYAIAIAREFNYSLSYAQLENLNKEVDKEHYIDSDGNYMGYTFRDVLDDIAEALGCRIKYSVGMFTNNQGLNLKVCYNDTNTTLNEEYFNDKNVNIGKLYGPINVVVLSRASESDNIHYPANLPNNPVELKIIDNPILEQDNRQTFIEGIYNAVNGLSFYFNDFTTKGLCIYETGDLYNASIDNVSYRCMLLNDDMKRTTGLIENIHTDETEQSVPDYKYSSSTDKAEINSRNAKILVDKANGRIDQIVKAVGENGEVTTASIVQSINDSGSQIQLNADKIYINGVTFDSDQNMTITEGTINIQQSYGDNSIYTYAYEEQTGDIVETSLFPAGTFSDIRDSNDNIIQSAEYYSTGTRITTVGGNTFYAYGDEISFRDSNNNETFKVDGITGNTTIGGNLSFNRITKGVITPYALYVCKGVQQTPTAWNYTQVDMYANGNSTYWDNAGALFERNGNGIQCKFDGLVMIHRQINHSERSEFDLNDEFGDVIFIGGTSGVSISIKQVSSGDIINMNFITGATWVQIYSARIYVQVLQLY